MRKGKVANLPSPIQPVAVEFVQSSLPEGLGADLHTVKKLRSDDPEALDWIGWRWETGRGPRQPVYGW